MSWTASSGLMKDLMKMHSHAVSHSACVSRRCAISPQGYDLHFREWACVDLNHGPLPYQGSALTD